MLQGQLKGFELIKEVVAESKMAKAAARIGDGILNYLGVNSACSFKAKDQRWKNL